MTHILARKRSFLTGTSGHLCPQGEVKRGGKAIPDKTCGGQGRVQGEDDGSGTMGGELRKDSGMELVALVF